MLMQTRTLRALLVLGIAAVTASAAHAQDPARTEGWVVLALDDYRALRARAFPSKPDPLPPPVDATLTRVDYDLRVNGDTVTGEARLTVDVLKQGWVSIQMPAGMLVRGAQARRPPDRARRRHAAARARLPQRPLGHRARDRHANRVLRRSGVDDAAAVRIGPLGRHLDRAARRCRPHRQRRIRRRAKRERDREPLDGVRRRRAAPWPSPGSARSTTGVRRCRCARAHASPSSSRSARKAVRSPPACASKSSRAWLETSCYRRPRASPSTRSPAPPSPSGRTRGGAHGLVSRTPDDLHVARRVGRDACAARWRRRHSDHPHARSRTRDRRRRRRRGRRRRDHRPSAARLRPGRPERPRRHRRRPRVAVDGRVRLHAARRRRAARA